jgi:hypothetical protein
MLPQAVPQYSEQLSAVERFREIVIRPNRLDFLGTRKPFVRTLLDR